MLLCHAQPVKGTMTVCCYVTVPWQWSSICIKKMSLLCTDCFRDGVIYSVCDRWQTVFLARSDDNADTDVQHSDVQTDTDVQHLRIECILLKLHWGMKALTEVHFQ